MIKDWKEWISESHKGMDLDICFSGNNSLKVKYIKRMQCTETNKKITEYTKKKKTEATGSNYKVF